MLVKTDAIVISSIKYGEADLIVKIYTLADGLKTYMLKGVLKSRKGKFKASMFQPLSRLEIVAKHRGAGKMEYLRDAKVTKAYENLHSDPLKISMTMFLAEMLKICIREEEPNKPLFKFLQFSLDYLDVQDRFANFHLLFLLHLSRYLGFQPETEMNDLPVFNLLDGVFQEIETNDYCIEGKNVELLKTLLGTDFDGMQHIKLNQETRNDFLKMLLVYYELHVEGFHKPRSLQVLNEIFG